MAEVIGHPRRQYRHVDDIRSAVPAIWTELNFSIGYDVVANTFLATRLPMGIIFEGMEICLLEARRKRRLLQITVERP